MISKRLFLPIAIVLASGLIAAGCGGDDDTSSAPAATTPEATDTTGGGATTGVPGNVSAAVQAAVDACKQSVNAAPNLSANTINDLEGICEDAGSGDVAQAQQASAEVCEKIVEDTVPPGSAQDAAKSACKSAAP